MEDEKLVDDRSWYKDTICVCCHWFEEHSIDGSGTPCDTCAGNASDVHEEPCCTNFTFDPEQNTPESIADRGGKHDLAECDCALCDWSRKKFIAEVRGCLIRDEAWRKNIDGSNFIEAVSGFLDAFGFGPRPVT